MGVDCNIIYEMSYRLTRKELRIIAETKKEGDELERQKEVLITENDNSDKETKKKSRLSKEWRFIRAIFIFALIFVLLAIIMRLILALLT